jgi:3-oxoacyl-[acyl-carrier-protein] synthase-3
MYVPERRVTNKDLEACMDTTDEWIRQRSGIVERRWIAEGQQPADLAEAASRQALERAGLEPGDIDCIVLATLSPQADFPGTSFFLQERLGGTTPCFDLRAQCSGFIFGLAVARGFIASGQFRRVLLVGCEVHSTGVDISTEGRDVAVLFGDGAGAVVVEANADPEDPRGSTRRSSGSRRPAPATRRRGSRPRFSRAKPTFRRWTASSCSSTP